MDSIGLGVYLANLFTIVYVTAVLFVGVIFYLKKKKTLAFFWTSFLLNIIFYLYFAGGIYPTLEIIGLIIWPTLNIILLLMNVSKTFLKK